MGRPKRLYPLGKYRLRIRGAVDNNKPYLVELEYTWNRQIVRKGMNIFVKVGDWNEKLNKGRGGVKSSYGPEANRINGVLLNRVDRIDGLLAEYSQKFPNQITVQLINDFLADKPVIREDKGKDFVEFALEPHVGAWIETLLLLLIFYLLTSHPTWAREPKFGYNKNNSPTDCQIKKQTCQSLFVFFYAKDYLLRVNGIIPAR